MKRAPPEEPEDDGGPLFALPPHNGRPTSIAAAYSMAPAAATLRAKILEWLTVQPNGATRQEIEEALDLEGNTVRPRVRELIGAYVGFPARIHESGELRKTRSGRMAEVLRVLPNRNGPATPVSDDRP